MIGLSFMAIGLMWLALSWYLAKRVPGWLSIRKAFAPTYVPARRASVPGHLRARGRYVHGMPMSGRQPGGVFAPSVATANWLRCPGTATRHACGTDLGASCGRQSANTETIHAYSMRLAGDKWLGMPIDGVRRSSVAQADAFGARFNAGVHVCAA